MAEPDDVVARTVERWTSLDPDLDLSATEIVLRIRRAASHIITHYDRVIEASPLKNIGDFDTLAALRPLTHPARPSELAELLLVTRAGITGRLNRLELLHLIERTPDPHDSRSSLITVTTTGGETADSVQRQIVAAEHAIIAGLSATQRHTLIESLRTLLLHLNDTP